MFDIMLHMHTHARACEITSKMFVFLYGKTVLPLLNEQGVPALCYFNWWKYFQLSQPHLIMKYYYIYNGFSLSHHIVIHWNCKTPLLCLAYSTHHDSSYIVIKHMTN